MKSYLNSFSCWHSSASVFRIYALISKVFELWSHRSCHRPRNHPRIRRPGSPVRRQWQRWALVVRWDNPGLHWKGSMLYWPIRKLHGGRADSRARKRLTCKRIRMYSTKKVLIQLMYFLGERQKYARRKHRRQWRRSRVLQGLQDFRGKSRARAPFARIDAIFSGTNVFR